MLRRMACVLVLSALLMSVGTADTYGEKVKAVDVKANTVTIVVDKKEKTFKVDAKATFLAQQRGGKGGSKVKAAPAKDGLKAVNVGDEVVVTTELKEGEEVITKIVILTTTPAPPAKKVEPKKE